MKWACHIKGAKKIIIVDITYEIDPLNHSDKLCYMLKYCQCRYFDKNSNKRLIRLIKLMSVIMKVFN